MKPNIHGFLIIDKPAGLTSRDAVDRAQGWFPRRSRIGHAGTLDPLATGVLPLAVGNATRLIEYVQRWDKVYQAGIRLGGVSDTDDAEGTITPLEGKDAPDRPAIEQALAGFLGEIEQAPPAYSAAKVDGRRAYQLARQGQEIELAPRRVRIDQIDIRGYDYPRLDVDVRCGKGTYIRSLARDLGQRLGCGGYIEALRRTRVGRFDLAHAISLDADHETALRRLLPLEIAVAELPRIELPEPDLERLRHGSPVPIREGLISDDASEAAVFDAQGRLALIARVDREHGRLCPDKVMAG